MKALVYTLHVPQYLLTRGYFKFFPSAPPLFLNLSFHRDYPDPRLPSENWVVVKSLLSGVCGSDLNMLRGNESFYLQPYASSPFVPGHENVGDIAACGSGVSDFKVGDRVVVNPVLSCVVHERAPCFFCRQGEYSLCDQFSEPSPRLAPGLSLGYHRDTGGGWSEYFLAHRSQLFHIPQDGPLERAVLCDPFCSALQGVGQLAGGKQENKKVLIFGGGTIGLLAISAIRALQLPWQIICVYKYEFQGHLAHQLGADHTIAWNAQTLQSVCDLTKARVLPTSIGLPVVEGGVDAVLDCVGTKTSLQYSLRFAKTRGTVLLLATATTLDGVDPTPIWFREVTLAGSAMSRSIVDPRDGIKKSCYRLFCDLFPKLAIEFLVTKKVRLENFHQGLSETMNKKNVKSVKTVFDLT